MPDEPDDVPIEDLNLADDDEIPPSEEEVGQEPNLVDVEPEDG